MLTPLTESQIKQVRESLEWALEYINQFTDCSGPGDSDFELHKDRAIDSLQLLYGHTSKMPSETILQRSDNNPIKPIEVRQTKSST